MAANTTGQRSTRGRRLYQRPAGCRRQAGFTLVAVLLVAVILLTLLAAVSTLVLAESKQTVLTARQQQAYNLAEAGLERFMAALQQAADGASDFPYDPGDLGGWIDRHAINQPGVAVTATYVREDGQPVTANQVPPYPHLIQVRSTGTVDQVSKTIVATVDLQFLGGLFQYALAALSKNGKGIQFDRDLVNLYPDLTINGRIYSNADIRWGKARALPPMLQTHSLAVDLGPNSPIQSRQDLQNVPSWVPVERLGAPLAYPTYEQMVASLKKRAPGNVQTIDAQVRGILLSIGPWSVYLPSFLDGLSGLKPIQAIWKLLSWRPIWIASDTVYFTNPNLELFVIGNPQGKTIISEGELHLIGLQGDSSRRTLYIGKKDVFIGVDQIPNVLNNVLGDVSKICAWLLAAIEDILNGILSLLGLLQVHIDLLTQISHILQWILQLLQNVIPPDKVTGYVYAPNGTVTFGSAFMGLHGGVAGQHIHFHFLNAIQINYQNTDLMADFDPSRRPELYIPQPVIVERHTE
ncbi:prepilin-type N-terminal cleavage/methylation domain-containing protein [Kyrpidia spormannii]|uniref:Uncharacterized protein n=1 Tax=Kyrpidia spormannii TaxID=2055160 RepID=A0A6F9EI30_9BACL|nr:prepilin-type N-terminal cleavage/methylation domain-containing protein [Kyrpidia spormannii]CAB3396148.1 conserved protein of unknown function [Kyrpidia spormannii]